MNAFLKKSAVAAVAALTLGLGTVAATTPVEAAGWAWHGGWGGGWHGGWGGGWHGGWGRGWGWGPAVGLGVVGGAVAGAAIASNGPYYGYYGPYYGPGPYAAPPPNCTAYRPVYDAYGHYLGRRSVDVCQ